jgi:hypothetical protein
MINNERENQCFLKFAKKNQDKYLSVHMLMEIFLFKKTIGALVCCSGKRWERKKYSI